MTAAPRRTPLLAGFIAFLGLGLSIDGIVGLTRPGGGGGGWALDGFWLVFGLYLLTANAGPLVQHFRERRRASRLVP